MTDKTKPPQECNPRHGWMGWWPGWAALFDPENGRIRTFLTEQATGLKNDAQLLDASAGRRPYAALFNRQQYESCDVPGGFYKERHDFECPLDEIPKPDGHYDAVVLTQVLEHVPHPEAVLREIHRVLRPGGRLLISVPLNGPLHGEPWHFFHFTHYGLAELAQTTGFEIAHMEKVGGVFWFLGKHGQDIPRRIMKSVDPARAKKRGQSIVFCVVATLLFLPFWLVSLTVLTGVVRPACYWLDRLDIQKTLTLGYTTVFQKPEA